jgi:hypothetical protein
MTRESEREYRAVLRELRRALRASRMRKPYWRVFKRELPRCGARCRDGHPCQAPAAWDEYRCAPRNGRCRLHGGFSTGPRTAAGKRRAGEAARRRAQMRRDPQVGKG